MKRTNILKIAFLALPLMFSSCIFHKKKADAEVTTNRSGKKNFIEQVRDNEQSAKFITSKVKFSVEVGPQKLTLTGNLKMKRDDVIRLQLMAFGFVEAGRIEFTKDYVLVMDRINKQYLKASIFSWISCVTVVCTSHRSRRCSGMNCSSLTILKAGNMMMKRRETIQPLRVATT